MSRCRTQGGEGAERGKAAVGGGETRGGCGRAAVEEGEGGRGKDEHAGVERLEEERRRERRRSSVEGARVYMICGGVSYAWRRACGACGTGKVEGEE